VAYQQLRNPNLDPVVYQNGKVLGDWYGWCLATVQSAFNTGWAGPNAWDAWNNRLAYKHADRNIPSGVFVPIWFSGYSGLGHVAIYKDGQIWTSPFTHIPNFYTGYKSIDALARGYGITYVGWSEDIGGVRVVQPQPVNIPQGGNNVGEKITVDTSRILAHGVLARNGVAGRAQALDGGNVGDAWVGQELTNKFVQDLFLSDEARQWRDSSDPNSINGINNRLAAGDSAIAQVGGLQGQITNFQKTIDELNKTIELGDRATKQQLQDALNKVSDLTAKLQQANDKLGQLQQNVPPTDPSVQGQLDALNSIKAFLKKLFGDKK
jgi:hypothetical protein